MFNLVTKAIAGIFGTKSERDMKEVTPYVALINGEYAKLKSISDDQLRGKTAEVQKTIAGYLSAIDNEVASLQKQVADNLQMDLNDKEDIFNKIDKLGEERNKKLEEVLMQVLPLSFAIVKETARRL